MYKNKTIIPMSTFFINKNKYYFYIVFIFCLKIIFSYYIPVNLNPGAPHDDTLFYRLGLSISNGHWLGTYDPTTLIKGIGYPLFLSLAIKLHLPIRVLESLLICGSSFYFILSLNKFYDKRILAIGLTILVFYPYQYGPLDFRLLRDMIYPQLLLIIFASVFYIISNSTEFWKKFNYIHGLILGASLYFFVNTREEGIWIYPSLFLGILIGLFLYKKNGLLSKFLYTVLLSVLVFIFLLYSHKYLNYRTLGAPITNIFKESNFQKGYGSLLRVSSSNLTYDTVTKNTWEEIFKVSPTSALLKKYIIGPSYQGWLDTGCDALKSIQRDMTLSSCYSSNPSIPVGHFMFALMDAISSAGNNDPKTISAFMKQLSIEIDQACDKAEIKCTNKPLFMMPSHLFNQSIFDVRILKIFNIALFNTINYENPNLANYELSPHLQSLLPMHKKMGGYLFPPKNKTENNFSDDDKFAHKKMNSVKGSFGFIEGVTSQYGNITIYGWALSQKFGKFSKVHVLLNDKLICIGYPSISRIDINAKDPANIGFVCQGVFLPRKDERYELKAYAIDSVRNTSYQLNITPEVKQIISNEFNAECYLDANPDVKQAVQEGKITAIDHLLLYGKNEKRKCVPIYYITVNLENYAEFILKNTLQKNSLTEIIYNFLNKLYHYLNLVFIAIIPIGILVAIKKKFYTVGVAITLFLCLFITRVSLLTILDYLGMAVISPLYLASGTYSYFIAGVLSLMVLLKIGRKNFTPDIGLSKKIL